MTTGSIRANLIHYYWDIGWWGLYAGTLMPFLSVYAVRSGATNEQLGLLTAAPAAISLLLSLPVGRWSQRFSPKRATVASVFAQRGLMVLYPLLPWILPPEAQVVGILAITAVIALPNTVTAISFNQLLMDAIPPEYRGLLIGNRIAIFSIMTFFVTLLAGYILETVTGAGGYQIIFAIGFVGAIMTGYHLSRVNPLQAPAPSEARRATGRAERMLPSLDGEGRRFIKIMLLVFVLNASNALIVPLMPPFAVKTLLLSDQWIGIGAAINTFFVFLISLGVARLTRRMGNRRATVLGVAALALAAVVLVFTRDAALYLAAMVVSGAAAGILNTAQFNYVLDNIPPATRAAWFAVLSMSGHAAVLIGSLGGPALAGVVSFPVILGIVAGLRLLVGGAILKWG